VKERRSRAATTPHHFETRLLGGVGGPASSSAFVEPSPTSRRRRQRSCCRLCDSTQRPEGRELLRDEAVTLDDDPLCFLRTSSNSFRSILPSWSVSAFKNESPSALDTTRHTDRSALRQTPPSESAAQHIAHGGQLARCGASAATGCSWRGGRPRRWCCPPPRAGAVGAAGPPSSAAAPPRGHPPRQPRPLAP
jgi:hypothetical protein